MVRNHVRTGLILEHPEECELFNKRVKNMGLDPKLVKRITALWLVLEDYGYQGFTKVVLRQDNRTITQFFKNGVAILECTKPSAKPVDRNSYLWIYFKECKLIYKSFCKILSTLCNNIFGEYEALEVVKREKSWVVKEEDGLFGEGSSGGGGGSDHESTLNPNAPEFYGGREQWLQSTLNPNATLYEPLFTREVFVAFRYGYPPTVPEIAYFFNEWFSAPIVEHVNEIRPPPGYPPLCAVVAFTDAAIVPVVLGGGTLARLTTVDGKEMWVTAYGQFPPFILLT
ncbi:hypothetical protein LOK49_LG13G01501 [Camellia lanceoleosa]|uniref:Uncharacterized protein n=1 Tax=Camellia lanceoleosa TaxID=1840588 RepID=A0ACC0FP04_9ERIC|nr:hypothetical protein LOK49_LG13G01501 [Camellia lanceoleosa]